MHVVTYPIRFIRGDGSAVPPSDRVMDACPVIDITFASGQAVTALVDTGCEMSTIKPGIVPTPGAPIQSRQLIGVNHTFESRGVYLLDITGTAMDGVPVRCKTPFIVADIDNRPHYDAILGMTFLSVGQLVIDFRFGRFEFRIAA